MGGQSLNLLSMLYLKRLKGIKMELVQIKHDVVFADTLQIAEHFGKRHKNVLQAIDNLSSEVRARLNFQPSKYNDSSGKSNKKYLLDRDAFSFIVMGFTGQDADKWKLNYISAFNQMESIIRERNSSEWQLSRQNGKMVRKMEADVIADFIVYAMNSGSENSQMYYKHFSELVNKTAGIINGEREFLTPQLLAIVGTIEIKVAELIKELMAKGLYYKEIYHEIKHTLQIMATFLPHPDEKYLPSPKRPQPILDFKEAVS